MANRISFISTSDVSETLAVSEQTVRTWCRLGVIPATRPSGTRKWLIVEDDFRAWLRDGAGKGVTAFLDPSHRSLSSEGELLRDADATLKASVAPKSIRRAKREIPRRHSTVRAAAAQKSA